MLREYDEKKLTAVLKDLLNVLEDKSSNPLTGDIWDVGYESNDETDEVVPTYVKGTDPVGVKIVTDSPVITVPRGSISWNSTKTFVTDQPQRILGRDERRRTFLIKHQGSSGNVAIDSVPNVKFGGTGANASFGSGELAPGDAITIDSCSDVWAICGAGLTNAISIFQVLDDGQ